MDLLEHPTPTTDVDATPMAPSQAILAYSFGCSFLALMLLALVSVIAG